MSARSALLMLVLSSFAFAPEVSAATPAKAPLKQSIAAKSSKAKSHSSKRHFGNRHISSRLIPPPPAYMPSILPELYYRGRSTTVVQTDDIDGDEIAEKPKNPYSKYIYSREGDVPKATQARSGVTNWGAIR
jgi:hypothetical protein